MEDKEKKYTTQKEHNILKIRKFCAYRDRCHAEVRSKLIEMKVYGDELEEILASLITDGYLNEERYARSFVRGKFRINKWGRNKIIPALKFKKIHNALIRESLTEIDEEEYRNVLRDLLEKKANELKNDQFFEKKLKLTGFAMQRGFEPDLINEILGELI